MCFCAAPPNSESRRVLAAGSRWLPGSSTFIMIRPSPTPIAMLRRRAKGAAGERSEPVEAAELHNAGGERGEDQRDHHEEQHAQENLAEGIEDVRRDLAHEGEELGRYFADKERGDAGDDADNQADENAIRQGAIGLSHGRRTCAGWRRLSNEKCAGGTGVQGAAESGLVGGPAERKVFGDGYGINPT
jgi:hypothetical protein